MVPAFGKNIAAWRYAWLAGWLLAVSPPVGAHAFDPFAEEKQAELQRVAEYLRQGNTHEALIQTDQAIVKFPKHGPFYTLKAQIFLKLGQAREAQSAVEQAIELTPDYALSYWIRGLVHQRQNNPAAAIGDFNQVLTREDHNQTLMAQAIGSRGMALADLGRHGEALEDLNRALEVRPEAFAERQFRAMVYLALGRLTEAEADIAELLAREPRLALLHRLQGELWIMRRDPARARTSLDRALELNPADGRAYRLRAAANKENGRAAAARADQSKACELGETISCKH